MRIKGVWVSPKQIDSADQNNNKSKRKDMLAGCFFKRNFKLFLVKDSKFTKFYLLPKIQKHQRELLRRSFISKFGFYTETYPLLDYQSLRKSNSTLKIPTIETRKWGNYLINAMKFWFIYQIFLNWGITNKFQLRHSQWLMYSIEKYFLI